MTPSPSIASSLLGGALIGTSASLLLLFSGRIAGISGIVGGLLSAGTSTRIHGDDRTPGWRVAFLTGLLVGGVVLLFTHPEAFASSASRSISPVLVIVAGLAVGIGTTLGNGCTSGHGVCGISRLSKRSIIATCLFMAVAIAVAFLTEHVFGVVSR